MLLDIFSLKKSLSFKSPLCLSFDKLIYIPDVFNLVYSQFQLKLLNRQFVVFFFPLSIFINRGINNLKMVILNYIGSSVDPFFIVKDLGSLRLVYNLISFVHAFVHLREFDDGALRFIVYLSKFFKKFLMLLFNSSEFIIVRLNDRVFPSYRRFLHLFIAVFHRNLHNKLLYPPCIVSLTNSLLSH